MESPYTDTLQKVPSEHLEILEIPYQRLSISV